MQTSPTTNNTAPTTNNAPTDTPTTNTPTTDTPTKTSSITFPTSSPDHIILINNLLSPFNTFIKCL